MKKIDFFRILIKSIGLFFLITISMSYLPFLLGILITGYEWQSLLVMLGGAGFLVIIYVFLILKTDQIIYLLKLDTGFDNSNFDLGNITKQSLFELAILIVGLTIMFSVLSDIISFIQIETYKYENQINPYLIGAIIKFVLSAILVVKSNKIATLLLK
jgi:hypothetical protein